MSALIKTMSLLMLFILQITGILYLPIEKAESVLPVDSQNGGDPFMVKDNDKTYYMYTTGGGVDILEIKSIYDTETVRRKTVYYAGNDDIVGEVWAPEIHKIGDKWYIVASALFDKNTVPEGTMPDAKEKKEHSDYYRYGFVLESVTDDIFGDYSYKGRLAPAGLNNIDGTYLVHNERLYFVSSCYLDVAKQGISICEMENPYTLKENSNGENEVTFISKPVFPFETNGWKVNEGPAVLYKNDKIYIVYSASGYSSGEYCLGMLCLTGKDPMKKLSWYKNPVKVFSKNEDKNLYHTGHCSFLYEESGEIFMIYHATNNKDFFASPRCTYVKQLEFLGDYPLFNN